MAITTVYFFTILICLLCLLLLLLIAALFYLLWARNTGRFPFPRLPFPAEEFYIQDQIILTGPEALLDDLARPQRGARLERLERLRFSELGDRVLDCPGLPHSDAPGKGLVIDLYRITGQFPDVARTIGRINNLLGGQAGQVSKDPNWLTGHPFEAEGSPFEAEGSPFEAEGSPSGPTPGLAQPEVFMKQWAFRNIELGSPKYTGQRVRVGIFDTSPYQGLPPDTATLKTVVLAQTPSDLELSVLHPTPSATPAPATGKAVDVRNHGYFIAGLVHALAPDSDIHLIRVLGNDNRGDLFTLLKAVFNFLKEAVKEQDNQPSGLVINLSLGVRVAPDEARFGLPGAVVALQYLMNAARCLGSVVAAAAGNNSAASPALPEPANLPARWVSAMGVAASTIDNQRACFSNQGRIAAPGGDGRPVGEQTDAGCHPRTTDCKDADCSSAVVGPVILPPYTDETKTAYLFWSGSSFSAPLVSGLAALVIQAGQGRFTPNQVEVLITCGATPTEDHYLGAGVINVRRTLEECLPAQTPSSDKSQKAS
jgi:subtilisin family serine protease